MSKQLLIESSDFSFSLDKVTLEESLQVENKNNTLVLKGVPCTILNRVNQNGRNYSESVMKESLKLARNLIESRGALCQAHDHPSGSYVKPIEASHIVTNAYVENVPGYGPVLFNDWEILPTENGKNLRALIESNCSIGTSIRGLGNMNGNNVTDYEFLGTDCVGNPSSSTFTRMFEKPVVVESVAIKEENDDQVTDSNVENINTDDMNINMSNLETMDDNVANPNVPAEGNINEFNNINSNLSNDSNLNSNDSSLGENNMSEKIKEAAEEAIDKVPAPVTGPADLDVTDNDSKKVDQPTASSPAVGYAPSEKDPATVVVQNVGDVVNVATREGEKLAVKNAELLSIINKHNDEMAEKQRELDQSQRLLGEAINRLKAYKAEFGESTMESLTADKESAVKAVKEQAVDNATKFVESIVDRATKMVEDILAEAKEHNNKLKAKYKESQAVNEQIVKHFKAAQKINESLAQACRTMYNSNRKSVRYESAARRFHTAHQVARTKI